MTTQWNRYNADHPVEETPESKSHLAKTASEQLARDTAAAAGLFEENKLLRQQKADLLAALGAIANAADFKAEPDEGGEEATLRRLLLFVRDEANAAIAKARPEPTSTPATEPWT